MSINTTPGDVAHPGSSGPDSHYKVQPVAYNSIYAGSGRESAVRMPAPEDIMSDQAAFARGRISSVRRTFCLFVVFDLGLTFILWVIYTQLIGDTGWRAFEQQVEGYTFTDSLFDTVMMAAVRFVFLLLAYALFRIRHWWTVAVTTLLSSAFLLVKVFMYNFGGSSKNPLSYCVLIVSFVLAWVETWFMDFKVIPWERKELLRFSNTSQNYGGYGSTITTTSQRARLLAPEDALSTATFDQYYSPVGTPEGSDNEEESGAASSRAPITPQQLEEYKQLAQKSWEILWMYLHMEESEWTHESGKTLQEGIIHSYPTKEYGKVFRLEGEVDIDAKSLWEDMVFNINTSPQWNPSLIECNTVMVIDDNTDIAHNIAAGVGGMVSSRDFLNVRHWGKREGMYLSAGCGVTHPDCPPSKKHTRGFNGPGGWVFKPIPGQPNSCIFVWFMNINLKGWIPQRAVDQATTSVLRDYLKHMRQHVHTLRVRA